MNAYSYFAYRPNKNLSVAGPKIVPNNGGTFFEIKRLCGHLKSEGKDGNDTRVRRISP